MYYVYVLLFEDGKLYVGYTSKLNERLNKHRRNEVQSTKNRGKFIVIYYEACLNKKDAIKREKYLKMGFGRRFLNNRLENYFSGSRWRAGKSS
ncbi:MAG: Excinuclease ABC C subunit protein [uncultured bacterium]|nr:MAG: Excinuclease ABC C subunit protein [uncultured bacterium]